ncbi:Paladin [Sciurus carolinensis]|uniref:Paladin n=1 Tax=Sciurus carolinensis TaxID=30640 RepID=A0AA41T6D9_SCICA|nr:Paladin [Sciurus carolinensis]
MPRRFLTWCGARNLGTASQPQEHGCPLEPRVNRSQVLRLPTDYGYHGLHSPTDSLGRHPFEGLQGGSTMFGQHSLSTHSFQAMSLYNSKAKFIIPNKVVPVVITYNCKEEFQVYDELLKAHYAWGSSPRSPLSTTWCSAATSWCGIGMISQSESIPLHTKPLPMEQFRVIQNFLCTVSQGRKVVEEVDRAIATYAELHDLKEVVLTPWEEDFHRLLEALPAALAKNPGSGFVFTCLSGQGRTMTVMVVALLDFWSIQGYSEVDEEELVSMPEAKFTKGEFQVVMEVVQLLPDGHCMKKEVDTALDTVSETMTPMHYHLQEIIICTYCQAKTTTEEQGAWRLQLHSMQYMERYVYLILFNAYIYLEKALSWQRTFSTWMWEVASKAGVYVILD